MASGKRRIHCGVCKEPLQDNDPVFMDEINTVTHQRCYSLETNLPIKDLGTYNQILTDNHFYHDFLDH
ncbi:MAG TPA: hypothetical protein VK061_10235 [Bacillota bacterium]|nr:hypothetical protein [Bacillota bacterium]